MTKYHEWKQRLSSQRVGYPVENGPPYRDPLTGDPVFPGLSPTPINGFAGSASGVGTDTVTLTVTSGVTADTTIITFVEFGDPSTSVTGLAECLEGEGIGRCAKLIAASLSARDPNLQVQDNADGTITLTSLTGPITTVQQQFKDGQTGAAFPRVEFVVTATGPLEATITSIDGPGADDGVPISIRWGEGTGAEYITQSQLPVSYTYAAPGEYLVVVDPAGGEYPEQIEYVTVTGTVVVEDPVNDPDVVGPFSTPDVPFFVRTTDGLVGVSTDSDPSNAELFVTPDQVRTAGVSDETKQVVHDKLIELGFAGLPDWPPAAAPTPPPSDGEDTVADGGGEPPVAATIAPPPSEPWSRHADADAWYAQSQAMIPGWADMTLAEKHAAALEV